MSNRFIKLVYNIFFIPIAFIVLKTLSLFDQKIRERESNQKVKLRQLSKLSENNKRIWFHASSMGEFEQAKPVIESIKKANPNIIIIVSFFSPSGYRTQGNYPYADYMFYLPFDSFFSARKFITSLSPDIAVFIRYELWINYLSILKKRNIPSFLICATIPGKKPQIIKGLKKIYYSHAYSLFDYIYTISDHHTRFFNSIGLKQKTITFHDTRFDRILDKVEQSKSQKILPDELFDKDDFVIVVGSSWEPDETILFNTAIDIFKENKIKLRMIVCPHEPNESTLSRIKQELPNSFLLSQVLDYLNSEQNENDIPKFLGKNHIIVDSIGKLLRLYANANCAYIGGAFGAGIHSVTEAAGYGLPLACGTGYYNSPDAINLVGQNVLKPVSNADELKNWILKMHSDTEYYKEISSKAKDYVLSGLGSAEKLADYILQKIQ